MENTSITCNTCGSPVNVTELLYQQMHSVLTNEFESKYSNQKKEIEKESLAMEKEKADLLKLKSDLDTAITIGVNKRITAERTQLEKIIREQMTEEISEELKSYQAQIEAKVKEVKDHNKLRADFQQILREKEEMEEKIKAEAEERITSALKQQERKIRKEADEKNELKLAEMDHVIKQLKVQLTEASRKADQGSGQLRGEVMETSLEEYLKQAFPGDEVEEIKKGEKGADCLHHVKTPLQQKCGAVYYETKRRKDFQSSWIPKFKADMQARNADIGVLVTEVYPKGMERMSLKDGIWICSFQEAKGLCHVLRESLILLHEAKGAQIDKGGKMEILYQYMVSNEFRMQIEAIVEGFTSMQKNLFSERRAMESIWKQRQKELEKVILNTTHIYSSIRGIAGNAVKSIKQLELGSSDHIELSPKKNQITTKILSNGSATKNLPRKK